MRGRKSKATIRRDSLFIGGSILSAQKEHPAFSSKAL